MKRAKAFLLESFAGGAVHRRVSGRPGRLSANLNCFVNRGDNLYRLSENWGTPNWCLRPSPNPGTPAN
jgi:hypothetical protein